MTVLANSVIFYFRQDSEYASAIHHREIHCEKYRNFTWFPGVEILRKGTVSANCAFPQNFHTRKSGEITVFFAVIATLVASTLTLECWWHYKKNVIDRQMKVYRWSNFLMTHMTFDAIFNIPYTLQTSEKVKSNNLIDRKK